MAKVTCSIGGDKSKVTVKWVENCQFLGVAEEHSVVIDQKVNEGGNNIGFKPTELLLIALGGCMGTTILSMAKFKEIEIDELKLDVSIERSGEGWNFTIEAHIDGNISSEEKEKLIKEAEEICKISNILRNSCNVRAVLK